jgi:hypothetical protein
MGGQLMPQFIYTIAVYVDADNQDEATDIIYSTPLNDLTTDCIEIEMNNDDFSDDFPLSLEYDEG